MSSKFNAKLGLLTLVAALLVAFGAFAFTSAKSASADPVGAPTVSGTQSSSTCATASPAPLTSGPCVVSGSQVTVVTVFEVIPATSTFNGALCVNSGASVSGATVAAGPTAPPSNTPTCAGTAPTGGVASAPTLNLTNATATFALASTSDVTAFLGDSCAPGAVYCASKTQVNSLGTAISVALTFTATISCQAGPGTVTFTSVQDSGGANIGDAVDAGEILSTTINCVTFIPASTTFACPLNAICVKKIDQFGNALSAIFDVQQSNSLANNFGSVARLQTSACNQTVGGVQPLFAFSTPSCTILAAGQNPCNTTQSCTTPTYASGLPAGVYRVIEVAQPTAGPTNCTLVDIWRGQLPLQLGGPGGGANIGLVSPALVTIPDTSDNRTLTFVNSCLVAGSPNAAGSRIVPVIGGSSQGVTNSANIEIVPAPGSDDDARIDIQVRDSSNIPIQGAHVTIVTDKGRIAVRTDIGTTTATGADVIEPSAANVGQNISGDTCDYFLAQSISSGAITFPYANSSPTVQDGFTDQNGVLSACLFVGTDLAPGTTPGTANITAYVEQSGTSFAGTFGLNFGTQNLILTTKVTVVGPPASITVSASPTTLNCGEKATITVTAKDAANQNVSDHTRVEAITNAGGVLGGTGSTIGYPGVGIANPAASTVAETFNGTATFFLLTSTSHNGPYEVVVTSGGSTGGVLSNVTTATILPSASGSPITNIVNPGDLYTTTQLAGSPLGTTLTNINGQLVYVTNTIPVQQVTGNAGVFSTPPVSSQVTVNCSVPAAAVAAPVAPPAVVAPRTGEGPAIRPPNTGDAGLADASGNGMTMWLIAGTVVFALAGATALKASRR